MHQGDALELLRGAESESFELFFADPPHFLSNNGVTCQSGKRASVNKGAWDKAPTVEEIQAFNVVWLGECKRLLKPDGALWVTGTAHNIYGNYILDRPKFISCRY